MQHQNFLNQVLNQASQIATGSFGKVAGMVKAEDNNQVLTETDLEIGQTIIAEIEKFYPNFNIIDEEAGVIDKKSEFTWVIDPIDGTSNFASGVPLYGTMIGLLQGDQPVAGGIVLPTFSEIYIAEKGQGAVCNGQPIHVSQETKLLSSLIAYSIDGHQEQPELSRKEGRFIGELVVNIRNFRASGSCFDSMMVAKGKFGGYLNQTEKIWDNVAQHVIIEEAGGVYTDFWGRPMNYQNPLTRAEDNFTVCTAAPALHQQLQNIVSQNFP